MEHLLGVLAGTMGTALGFGLFFQAKKIYERKAADEISYTTFGIFLINNSTWIAYGVVSRNIPIIVPNAVGLCGIVSILILAVRFNHQNKT